MKYIKTYESRTVNSESIKGLENFFKAYKEYENGYNYGYNYKSRYENSISRANNYNIPKELYDEFLLLDFYYQGNWKYGLGHTKEINNYIKKEIKKAASNSIISKLDNNFDLYTDLKKMFEKRPKWNNTGSFDNISDASIKYTYFLLDAALKNVPTIKNMEKFNL